MRTAKKRPDGLGGWSTTVTTDDGVKLTVTLIRGPYKRNWFGNDTYHWTARVVFTPEGHGRLGSGWQHEMLAGQGESAQRLARRGLRARAELDGRG